MKIAVVGLGAIGIALATFLKKENSVFGITKKKYIKNFPSNQLFVEGIWGKHSAILDGIFHKPQSIKENIDLIIISVKSYDTSKVLKQIKPLVKEKTLILIAQNGYGNYEKAVEMYGKEKVLLSRIIFGSKLTAPNTAYITVNADDIRIGDPSKTIPESKVLQIIETFKNSLLPTSYAPDVYQILWDKILYNSALNPLGALLKATYGQLAENPNTRQIMNQIIKEIFITTKANNIKLRWENPSQYIKHFYQNLIPPTKDHYPSMYYDLKNGKKTEIDALNGAIVRLARKKKITAKVNQTITSLIKFAEKGAKAPQSS